MKFSENGEIRLMSLEGFNETAEPCLAGHPSIGFGHKIKPGEIYNTLGYRMDKAEGFELLRDDVDPISSFLNNHIKVNLDQSQFDALVIFIYNIGETQFTNSTVFTNVKEGKFSDALIPWAKWINISKKVTDPITGAVTKKLIPIKGLINRRKAEIELFQT